MEETRAHVGGVVVPRARGILPRHELLFPARGVAFHLVLAQIAYLRTGLMVF